MNKIHEHTTAQILADLDAMHRHRELINLCLDGAKVALENAEPGAEDWNLAQKLIDENTARLQKNTIVIEKIGAELVRRGISR
jgi:hypothetical protein